VEAGGEEVGECVKDAQMRSIWELSMLLLYSYECRTPCLYVLTEEVSECYYL